MEDPLDIIDEFLDKKSNKKFTYKNNVLFFPL